MAMAQMAQMAPLQFRSPSPVRWIHPWCDMFPPKM
jgi:hypothetical protein